MYKEIFLNKLTTRTIFIVITVVLILFSAFKPIGFDKDSYAYLFDLNNLTSAIFTREYSFIVVGRFINYFLNGNVFYLFLFYALLSISLKMYCIYKYSANKFFSILIYLFLFYFIQDVTQIRVGLATAFLLLAYADICEKRYTGFFIKGIMAVFFHYQAILIFLIYFFNKLNLKLCFLIMMFSFVVFNFFGDKFKNLIIYILSKMNLEVISNKVEFYYNSAEYDVNSNFGLFQLFYLGILFCYLLVFLIKKNVNDRDLINLKVMCMTISVYFILSFNSVFALRVFEFFATLLVLILPMFSRLFKPSFVPMLVILIVCFIYYMSAVSDKLNFSIYLG